MIHQLFGPWVNLVGDGGFGAWSVGGWFVMKYANGVMFGLVAVLFVAGMLINLPDHDQDRR